MYLDLTLTFDIFLILLVALLVTINN